MCHNTDSSRTCIGYSESGFISHELSFTSVGAGHTQAQIAQRETHTYVHTCYLQSKETAHRFGWWKDSEV